MSRYSKFLLTLAFCLSFFSCSLFKQSINLSEAYTPDKREFRAVWLPTIYRDDYRGLTRQEGKALLAKRVQLLRDLGFNVIIFQVRSEFDAFYRSDIEPWSRFFTGKQGEAPDDEWDPLAYLVELCHRQGMELHAWLNPYRAAANAHNKLAPNHLLYLHPNWFIKYNNQYIINPALPEAREHVCEVVRDIVMRYDIDAIHLDDYFYPYPKAGEYFDDQKSFEEYGLPAGYKVGDKDSWRRSNVNQLIFALSELLKSTKPWVRLGISPFGIYRNKGVNQEGSATNGLQCYDDLYADVLYWMKQDWIDYLAPQIYWNRGNERADYGVLTEWWAAMAKHKRTHLYIGQHIRRSMDSEQLGDKLKLSQAHAKGNIFWPAEEIYGNYKGVAQELKDKFYKSFALLPEYKGALGRTQAPKPIENIWEDFNEDGHMLLWEDLHDASDPETPFMYVVYAFPKSVCPQIRKAQYIVNISSEASFTLPSFDCETEYTFMVTSVNRFWQESEPKKITIKL